jgi:hypothetical protein
MFATVNYQFLNTDETKSHLSVNRLIHAEPGVSGNMPIVASSFKDCMFTDIGHTPTYQSRSDFDFLYLHMYGAWRIPLFPIFESDLLHSSKIGEAEI